MGSLRCRLAGGCRLPATALYRSCAAFPGFRLTACLHSHSHGHYIVVLSTICSDVVEKGKRNAAGDSDGKQGAQPMYLQMSLRFHKEFVSQGSSLHLAVLRTYAHSNRAALLRKAYQLNLKVSGIHHTKSPEPFDRNDTGHLVTSQSGSRSNASCCYYNSPSLHGKACSNTTTPRAASSDHHMPISTCVSVKRSSSSAS